MDTFQIPQNTTQSSARRDAISKTMYERLFNLIIQRINIALEPGNRNPAAQGADDETGGGQKAAQWIDEEEMLSVGVLDIYGFEVFEKNGFEQLCINYVNEKLQQIFIELTLNAEQQEYAEEGIAWQSIPFFNNKIVCDLLDAARPSGLFRILDDTCKTMHGTKAGGDVDRKFLETAGQMHGSNAHFHATSNSFSVKHYAGDVHYATGNLAGANKDALDTDLLLVLRNSTDKLLKYIFQPDEAELEAAAAAAGGGGGGGGGSRKKAGLVVPSAGARIRTQTQALVVSLMECSPHYVRW